MFDIFLITFARNFQRSNFVAIFNLRYEIVLVRQALGLAAALVASRIGLARESQDSR